MTEITTYTGNDFDQFDAYDSIPMAVLVESRFVAERSSSASVGYELVEQPIPHPWTKDYRVDDDTAAREWSKLWDTSKWAYFLAISDDFVIGAAAVASRTDGVHMLQGRTDLGVLWDIRVDPKHQRIGVGRALFDSAANWCRTANLQQLKIETQDVNVPACRFYERMGCELRDVVHGAYGDRYPDEVQFLWWLDL